MILFVFVKQNMDNNNNKKLYYANKPKMEIETLKITNKNRKIRILKTFI